MSERQREIDAIRRARNERDNHLIDEYLARRISRKEFIRRGTIAGMSIPLVAWLAAACGGGGESGGETGTGTGTATTAGKAGGTFRFGLTAPSSGLDPITVADAGGLCLNGQTGEYLSLSLGEPELKPVLAESWTANEDATVWTFQIRQGVTFNDEAQTPMTTKDVAATFNRLADPKNKSNALSVFQGVLGAGATSAPDESTVVFELDAPNGNWPWLVSSDNYNAIIVPENYDGGWEDSWIGTGPFRMESYQPKVSATLVRNENYWGESALPDRVEITLYDDVAAAVLLLQGKQVDALDAISVSAGRAIINDTTNYKIIKIAGSTHRELSMRTDQEPFKDKRVRQAIALTLDRPGIIEGLFEGYADLGNDSPFAPVFASTNPDVPQRAKDIDQAKQLLSDAGVPDGFNVQMNAIKAGEVPQFAQIVQDSAKEIGVNIELVVQDPTSYYGDAVFGSSPWLDSVMSLVDYGHRGVPNVLLGAPLLSDGVWNAAHFKNKQYDELVGQFYREPDIGRQQEIAGDIQTLLLDETPIIFAYFYNILTPTLSNVSGVVPTAINHLFVDRASKA
jgi:peptide/nickel transport system substrate-binding protein